MYYVIDIEADALENPKNLWCLVAKNLETGEVLKYDQQSAKAGIRFLHGHCTGYIGHNLIGYDRRVISNLLDVDIAEKPIIDTLILSRLLKYNIEGGHSLEAWGLRLGYPKQEFNNFAAYSEEMLDYCVRDVEVTTRVYQYIWSKLNRKEFEQAIWIEHEIAKVCEQMHEDGFAFDVVKAKSLRDSLTKRLEELDTELLAVFPPRSKLIREVRPKLTKHGTLSRVGFPKGWTDLTAFDADCPFSLVTFEPFNPGSHKQIVDRLWEAGWQPTDKTKGHLEAEKARDKEALETFKRYGWKVSETNLATVPSTAPPAVQKLIERLLIAGRWRTLNEWLGCYDESTGRIHGRWNHIGTWTHRMSHSSPNLGNVATAKSIKYKRSDLQEQAVSLGSHMRSLWVCDQSKEDPSDDKRWWLVGTDAVGIQLRIFAHYINDSKFTEALIHGNSKLGTDAHSLNANILGCDRDTAKTFIYAYLLGAGDSKLGEILGGRSRRGREAKRVFSEAYPGLGRLRAERIRADASRGFFQTFDGRLITCDSEHLMLAGYLQAGEAVIMKYANILWRSWADEATYKYRQVNFIHDEWQTEVFGTEDDALSLGKLQCEAIREVGKKFRLNCPMDGETRFGSNWLETH